MKVVRTLAIAVALVSTQAFAGEKMIKIGVLGDESGPYSDLGGPGSVMAAQMAADDYGGKVLGKPIKIVSADMQNKPDVASSIARRWFDVEGVDAIADVPLTSVALAVQSVAREKKKILLITGAASADLTGKACSPYTVHWMDDSRALSVGTGHAVVAAGGKRWFFLTPDYAFGAAMERAASAAVVAAGGTVDGSTKFPLGTPDYSSFLLTAGSSPATIFGLSTVGGDTVTAVKQAAEFGLTQNNRKGTRRHRSPRSTIWRTMTPLSSEPARALDASHRRWLRFWTRREACGCAVLCTSRRGDERELVGLAITNLEVM
jgi:branched-chain amino acid transport system substrate-binding protein